MSMPCANDTVSSRTAIACSSNTQMVAIRLNTVTHLRGERAASLFSGSPIVKQPAADAGNIEYVVHVRFPVVGRPIDCVRDDRRDTFSDAVRGDHVEGFCVTRL